MASQKHCKAFLDALNRKEVPIETTPQEVLSLMGVEGSLHPLIVFFLIKISLPKELLTLDPYKSPLNAWVPWFHW